VTNAVSLNAQNQVAAYNTTNKSEANEVKSENSTLTGTEQGGYSLEIHNNKEGNSGQAGSQNSGGGSSSLLSDFAKALNLKGNSISDLEALSKKLASAGIKEVSMDANGKITSLTFMAKGSEMTINLPLPANFNSLNVQEGAVILLSKLDPGVLPESFQTAIKTMINGLSPKSLIDLFSKTDNNPKTRQSAAIALLGKLNGPSEGVLAILQLIQDIRSDLFEKMIEDWNQQMIEDKIKFTESMKELKEQVQEARDEVKSLLSKGDSKSIEAAKSLAISFGIQPSNISEITAGFDELLSMIDTLSSKLDSQNELPKKNSTEKSAHDSHALLSQLNITYTTMSA
jgi:hypothetical protein